MSSGEKNLTGYGTKPNYQVGKFTIQARNDHSRRRQRDEASRSSLQIRKKSDRLLSEQATHGGKLRHDESGEKFAIRVELNRRSSLVTIKEKLSQVNINSGVTLNTDIDANNVAKNRFGNHTIDYSNS